MFAVSSRDSCVWKLFYGTDFHSHLGTEFGGMAVLGHELVRRIHRITQSQFKTEFSPDLHLFAGKIGIGVISPKDEQPLIIKPINSHLGLFAIATYGYVDNADEIIDSFIASGIGFEKDDDETVNTTKLVGMMISQSDTLVGGIQKMFYRIKGSISLLVLNTDGIYAARSLHGHTPLYLARKDEDWAVTLETTALPNLGFSLVKPLLPGEIILLDENGPVTKSREYSNQTQLCPFLPVYIAFPSAEFGAITAEGYREKAGAWHAKCDFTEGIRAQMVAGMADSGTSYAVGYSKATHDLLVAEIQRQKGGRTRIQKSLAKFVPYRRPLVKYTPGWGRSYTPPKQVDRDRIAKMKQIPIVDIWDDLQFLILTEDSIVRGTQLAQYLRQLKDIVVGLWGKSWPEIHVRVGCPPLAWPCKYMLSTRSRSELAARRAVSYRLGHEPTDEEMQVFLNPENQEYHDMVSRLTTEMDVASLHYLPLEEMIRIIGMPADQVCTHCWTGKGV